ncbi:MAG: chemotaxis response regulator protein-glutamate methylesterase [Clostridiaceae bacterium]|jgi:two-component system chemotaxis response regulator CheB|nr:chemotaxis response regulator protein-glutamate methylesterase [Clostridiaceae bacterium]
MNDEKIRVLIVDDSALMRRIIQNILAQDPSIEIVGIAKDGIEALKRAQELNPDVITLDVEMPLMDGLSCLENLLKQGSYSVIMVSSFTKERANETIRALELGAFDFISKPENIFDMSSSDKQSEITEKVKLAYRSLKKAEIFNKARRRQHTIGTESKEPSSELKYIIALGVSTGGPRALSEILIDFPADLPAAIVIVQHMPSGFTASLATRLNEICRLKVKEAEDMDELKAGNIYIAPGDYHLTFDRKGEKILIKLLKTPPIGKLRPSVDVMMTSLSETNFSNIIGVIMTGMGSDGAKGLVQLKEKNNAFIIAQDEKTSTVFGMPRSAIEKGVVDKTVPLQKIPTCIMNFMGVRR